MHGGGSKCPSEWLTYNKHCYFLGIRYKTWQQARDVCVSNKAQLTSILDTFEQSWLTSALKKGSYWIGLSRKEAGKPWQWVDGKCFNYSFWAHGEPNNVYQSENCVEIRAHSGDWNNDQCHVGHHYICKRPLYLTNTTANVTCPTPAPSPNTTTAKPVTCPTPAPCPTTVKPTCPTSPPAPTTTKAATCPPCTTTAKPATCPPCTTTAAAKAATSPPCNTTAKVATCPTPAPCPTCPARLPPTNGDLEMCAIFTKEKACSSRNVTCSCLLAMTANLKGGFHGPLNGLSVARSIVIRGRSNPLAKRLVVNLDVRDASGETVTTALHLNIDLATQNFTLNSRVGRKWGRKQTRDLPQGYPFKAGLPFKIVIKCGSGSFHMNFNDQLQVDFTGPQLDIGSINWLEVWQVMLGGVQLM
ncbi:uncharacterized protein [Syngnathus scovelli]|uniref:uncharacterized protein isoform X2 n=1 Tax=Syngnathus scovelli TaxID=161590 RepID=UPI0021101700|nr:clotting factor C-like isoform X2 [Syngnathus scovelli]